MDSVSYFLLAMAMSSGSPAMMRGSYTGQMVPTSQSGDTVDKSHSNNAIKVYIMMNKVDHVLLAFQVDKVFSRGVVTLLIHRHTHRKTLHYCVKLGVRLFKKL